MNDMNFQTEKFPSNDQHNKWDINTKEHAC